MISLKQKLDALFLASHVPIFLGLNPRHFNTIYMALRDLPPACSAAASALSIHSLQSQKTTFSSSKVHALSVFCAFACTAPIVPPIRSAAAQALAPGPGAATSCTRPATTPSLSTRGACAIVRALAHSPTGPGPQSPGPALPRALRTPRLGQASGSQRWSRGRPPPTSPPARGPPVPLQPRLRPCPRSALPVPLPASASGSPRPPAPMTPLRYGQPPSQTWVGSLPGISRPGLWPVFE